MANKKRATRPHPISASQQARNTSPTMEQYVEIIAHLLTQDKVCTVSDIAKEAQVTKPAVSRAVRDLAEKGLVVHKSYGYVDLTDKGVRLAERLTARHHALCEFLREILLIDQNLADEEACRLEHQMGDDLVERLRTLQEWLGATSGRLPSFHRRLRSNFADTGVVDSS